MTVVGVTLDPKISLGQAIQIILLIFGIALAWGNADSRITANERGLERVDASRLEDKASSLERDAKQDATMTVLTKDYNTMALVLEGIRVDVGYLRRNVEDTKRAAASP